MRLLRTIRVLRSEQENDLETAKLREARLDEQIRKLEKEVSSLEDQIAAVEAEKSRLLSQPSSSHAFAFPDVPQNLYEKWIHVEAQLDIIKNLMIAGKVLEAEFEDVRTKAGAARITCGYDPSTPEAGDGKEYVDGIKQGAWYEDEYADGDGRDDVIGLGGE